MARNKNGILGAVEGKVGDVIGSSGQALAPHPPMEFLVQNLSSKQNFTDISWCNQLFYLLLQATSDVGRFPPYSAHIT